MLYVNCELKRSGFGLIVFLPAESGGNYFTGAIPVKMIEELNEEHEISFHRCPVCFDQPFVPPITQRGRKIAKGKIMYAAIAGNERQQLFVVSGRVIWILLVREIPEFC